MKSIRQGRVKRTKTPAISLLLILLAIGCAFFVPAFERWSGISLHSGPEVADRDSATPPPVENPGDNRDAGNSSQLEYPTIAGENSTASGTDSSAAPGPRSPSSDSQGPFESDADDRPLGELKDIGGGVLVSSAGLRYTRGSQEGHRLKHVMRHDNDIPDRPSKHGVFDGDGKELLRVLDKAYLLIKANDPRVKANAEGDRVVYDVDMKRRIGFVGGKVGKSKNHPPADRVRLVLEGDRVITAYPF